MELEEAIAQLKLLTDAEAEPEVSDEVLGAILARVPLRDANGLAPVDSGWIGTYCFPLACAQVFEIKAAKVATEFDFAADGASYKRSQKREAFLELAKEWRSKTSWSFASDLGGKDDVLVEVIEE